MIDVENAEHYKLHKREREKKVYKKKNQNILIHRV